jgi:hypothetical protein
MSRDPREFAVFAFHSTHDALDAETLLQDMGVEVVPIPAPAAVSGGCGIALRLEVTDEQRAQGYLEASQIRIRAQAHMQDV